MMIYLIGPKRQVHPNEKWEWKWCFCRRQKHIRNFIWQDNNHRISIISSFNVHGIYSNPIFQIEKLWCQSAVQNGHKNWNENGKFILFFFLCAPRLLLLIPLNTFWERKKKEWRMEAAWMGKCAATTRHIQFQSNKSYQFHENCICHQQNRKVTGKN